MGLEFEILPSYPTPNSLRFTLAAKDVSFHLDAIVSVPTCGYSS